MYVSQEDWRQMAEQVAENNKILHQLRGAMRWGRFFSLIKWVIILGSAGTVYYYLQPVVEQARQTYTSLPDLNTLVESLKNITNLLPR